jgi:hypothetical protein
MLRHHIENDRTISIKNITNQVMVNAINFATWSGNVVVVGKGASSFEVFDLVFQAWMDA